MNTDWCLSGSKESNTSNTSVAILAAAWLGECGGFMGTALGDSACFCSVAEEFSIVSIVLPGIPFSAGGFSQLSDNFWQFLFLLSSALITSLLGVQTDLVVNFIS
jgi:hypothetical protein